MFNQMSSLQQLRYIGTTEFPAKIMDLLDVLNTNQIDAHCCHSKAESEIYQHEQHVPSNECYEKFLISLQSFGLLL